MIITDYSGCDNLEIMREAVNYNRFLLDLIIPPIADSNLIVDFGAGSGTFAFPIAAISNRLVCVETDSRLSEYLSSHGLAVVSNLDLLEDSSVDYLYSLNVLEHIADDLSTVKLWMKKLRPGGHLFVYVPAFQVLFSGMDRKVGHLRRYTKSILVATLAQAGFCVTESKYADSLGFLATLLYKAFGDTNGHLNIRMLKAYDSWIFPISRSLDLIFSSTVGKNVYARAFKPF